MGSVHQQTVNEGRGCEEFYHICLSEINTIKALILNRDEFDPCFESKTYYNSHPFVTNGVPLFQEPVEVLYLDLEKLIKECNFTNQQRKFITDVMLGKENFYYKVKNEKVLEKFETEKYVQDGDKTVKKIIVTEKEVIRFKDDGYDEELHKQFDKILNYICKKIKEQNDYNWKTWTETSGIIKISDNIKYKRCNTCKKDLRTDNFGNDDRNKDGKKSICKKCDSYTKKTRNNG